MNRGEPDDGGKRWVVDGMNVIGSRPDGWWKRLDEAVEALIERLAAFAEKTGERTTVVFDHRPAHMSPGERGPLTVAFAAGHGRGSADDEITGLVESAADPATLRVVTSDRQLAERVRALGAVVYPAGRFRERLDRSATGG